MLVDTKWVRLGGLAAIFVTVASLAACAGDRATGPKSATAAPSLVIQRLPEGDTPEELTTTDECWDDNYVWCKGGADIRELMADSVLGDTTGNSLELTGVVDPTFPGSGMSTAYPVEGNSRGCLERTSPSGMICLHVAGGFDQDAMGCPPGFTISVTGPHGAEFLTTKKSRDTNWHGMAAAKYEGTVTLADGEVHTVQVTVVCKVGFVFYKFTHIHK